MIIETAVDAQRALVNAGDFTTFIPPQRPHFFFASPRGHSAQGDGHPVRLSRAAKPPAKREACDKMRCCALNGLNRKRKIVVIMQELPQFWVQKRLFSVYVVEGGMNLSLCSVDSWSLLSVFSLRVKGWFPM